MYVSYCLSRRFISNFEFREIIVGLLIISMTNQPLFWFLKWLISLNEVRKFEKIFPFCISLINKYWGRKNINLVPGPTKIPRSGSKTLRFFFTGERKSLKKKKKSRGNCCRYLSVRSTYFEGVPSVFARSFDIYRTRN